MRKTRSWHHLYYLYSPLLSLSTAPQRPKWKSGLLTSGRSAAPKFLVKLVHRRAEPLPKSIEGDERHARPPNIRSSAHFAGDPGQDSFAASHDEDLTGAPGGSGTVTTRREELDRQCEDIRCRQAGYSLALERRAVHLGFGDRTRIIAHGKNW